MCYGRKCSWRWSRREETCDASRHAAHDLPTEHHVHLAVMMRFRSVNEWKHARIVYAESLQKERSQHQSNGQPWVVLLSWVNLDFSPCLGFKPIAIRKQERRYAKGFAAWDIQDGQRGKITYYKHLTPLGWLEATMERQTVPDWVLFGDSWQSSALCLIALSWM